VSSRRVQLARTSVAFVDELEPRDQRLSRVVVSRQGLGGVAELLDVIEVDRLQQVPAGGEVPVQRSRSDAGSPCHLLERCVDPIPEGEAFGGGDDQLAVASCISARLAGSAMASYFPSQVGGGLPHAVCPVNGVPLR
jgi:hypothetical protein